MQKTVSRDGTPIAYDRHGQGQALILVDGALCYRASGPSAALALEAASRGLGVTKLALFEAPFIVDDTRPPIPDDFLPRLNDAVASGRRSDAVKSFMTLVGVPGIAIAMMRLMPAWAKLTAVAHTLPYDITLVKDHEQGRPLSRTQWSAATIPTLVMDGGKSPTWMRNAMKDLSRALPNARTRTLPGQAHMVNAKAHAPALVEFFNV